MSAENNKVPINFDRFEEIKEMLLIENPTLQSKDLKRIKDRWKLAKPFTDAQIKRRVRARRVS